MGDKLITEAADLMRIHGLDYAMAMMDDLAILITNHPHVDKEAFLASVTSYPELVKEKKRWLSKAETCDLCKGTLTTGEYFADARIPKYGQWGLICSGCAEREHVAYGCGRGQKYSSEKPYYKLEG